LSTLPVSLSRNLLHNIEFALSSAATDYSDIRPGSEFCLSQPPFEQGARFGYMMQHSFVCV